MADIIGYEYVGISSTIIPSSELESFSEDNDVVDYEIYEGEEESDEEE